MLTKALLHGRFLHRLRILIFCQNKMNSTTLKQMTKDERLNQWKPKISCKPAQNFVKCSHIKFLSFLCPQNCAALFVGHASNLSFAAPLILIVLPFYERKLTEKPLLQHPGS